MLIRIFPRWTESQVLLSNVSAVSENGAFISGDDAAGGRHVRGLILRDVRVTVRRWTDPEIFLGGQHDYRPSECAVQCVSILCEARWCILRTCFG